MSLLEEIHEQPDVLANWLDTQLESVRRIADAIRARDIEYVFLAARGTSDIPGCTRSILGVAKPHTGRPRRTVAVHHVHGETPAPRKSPGGQHLQSGQSPDIVSVIAEGRRRVRSRSLSRTIRFSTCASAEHTIDIHAGPEKAGCRYQDLYLNAYVACCAVARARR